MQIIIRITVIVLIGLSPSCKNDKPPSEVAKVEHRILDRADLLTQPQEDSIFTLILDIEE